jgi:hypothetical protein
MANCIKNGLFKYWELSRQKEDDKNVNLKSENFQRSKKKKKRLSSRA